MVRFSPVCCPNCFTNFGMRETAARLARRQGGQCPACGRQGDLKLSRTRLEEVVVRFFVSGSYISETFAPVYQVNSLNPSPATFDPTLATDAALACRLTGQVVFHYGPPLWRLGMTEHYYEFEAGGEQRSRAAAALVAASAPLTLPSGSPLFRIRLNVKADEQISTATAFDPPPASVVRDPGRWDELNHPVLYVSDDIELCLHECRATIADEIVVATLHPTRDLRLLDLATPISATPGTPFDDPNIFVGVMCRSRGPWLEHCRAISRAAKAAGYDGIRYESYYSQAKHAQKSLNLALFGKPLQEKLMVIGSVNRLRISDMAYQFEFGPVLYQDSQMRAELAGMKAKWREIADDLEGQFLD